MRKVGLFIVGALTSGLIAFVGCSSSGNSGSGTGGTTSTSTKASTTTSTTVGTGGTSAVGGGGAGGGEGSGGGPANFACTIPSPLPSMGSCVAFTPGDAGEIDAGIDMNGDPSITNCNPVTNAGCTGTDVCGPDVHSATNMNYFCQPAGSPAGLAPCADCSGQTATCGGGGICIGVNSAGTEFFCAQMCCTDADCGASGSCSTSTLSPALPSGVGVCIPM